MKETPKDFATPEKQDARSLLRERFLRLLSGITDKECQIHLFDNTVVSAKFGGTDIDVLQVYVKDLDSPVYKVPQALLRTSDILSIEVPDATFQKLLDPQDVKNGNTVEGMEVSDV